MTVLSFRSVELSVHGSKKNDFRSPPSPGPTRLRSAFITVESFNTCRYIIEQCAMTAPCACCVPSLQLPSLFPLPLSRSNFTDGCRFFVLPKGEVWNGLSDRRFRSGEYANETQMILVKFSIATRKILILEKVLSSIEGSDWIIRIKEYCRIYGIG